MNNTTIEIEKTREIRNKFKEDLLQFEEKHQLHTWHIWIKTETAKEILGYTQWQMDAIKNYALWEEKNGQIYWVYNAILLLWSRDPENNYKEDAPFVLRAAQNNIRLAQDTSRLLIH